MRAPTCDPRRGVVALLGLRGVGKTTLGRALAARLGCAFEDSDARLARLARRVLAAKGQSVPADLGAGDVLEHLGERGFRDVEALVLAGLLAPRTGSAPDCGPSSGLDRGADAAWPGADAGFADRESWSRALALEPRPARPLILATGGGIVERPANRALLYAFTRRVWLVAPTAVLAARTARDLIARPALDGALADPIAEFERLAARRAPAFAGLAERVVATDAGDVGGLTELLTRIAAPLLAAASEPNAGSEADLA